MHMVRLTLILKLKELLPTAKIQSSTFQEHERDWGKADTTNKQGQFSLQFGEEIFDDNTLRLKVIATDLNNTYQNDTSKIEFLWSDVKRNKKKRKDDWYDGKATKTVNFTLKEKNDK